MFRQQYHDLYALVAGIAAFQMVEAAATMQFFRYEMPDLLVVLADDADETSSAKMIPVQLPTGKVRDALNLVDNFGNLGKNVCVYGTIEKYFTVAGVKGVSDYSLDGIVTAIDKVETTTAQGAIYTIAGQRINHINHAGIYVVGGKKVVVK